MAQAELIGNLKLMSLATLLSINCNEQKTIRIEVKQGQYLGNIFVDKGKIVHAEFDGETGEAAFNKIFAFKEGNFSIYPDELVHTRTIEKSWSNLVLESARLLDENSLQARENTDWDNLDLSDFGFDTDEKIMDEQKERLLKALFRLTGIESVAIFAPDFSTLGHLSHQESVDYTPALKLLFEIGNNASQYIQAGNLCHLIVRGVKNLILINRGQDIIFLSFKEAGNLEKLLEEIYLNIKRYR
ncbi:DUF4388 domain-containing protein [candidate division KSB1 bacterium]|nr:DUF4388 domain-containing protein [candidate division KSB1 bacterium]